MRRYTVEIKKQALDDLKVLSKMSPKPIKRPLNSLQNFMSTHRLVQGNLNNLRGAEAHCGVVASLRSIV